MTEVAQAPAGRRMGLGAARGALGRERVSGLLRQSGLLWALIALCVVASLSSSAFLQSGNLINVAREAALIGIVGIGMTFVILTAGIDLSVGAIVGVVAVTSAEMLSNGSSMVLVIVAGIALGGLVGAVNGLGIVNGRIPAFVMTLAMLTAGRGIALAVSEGQPVSLGDQAERFSWLGNGSLLGLPVPVWIFIALLAIAAVILRKTPYGRYVFAVGDNPEAARLAGINTGLITFSVYVISGLLAGLTALVYVSRLTSGDPTLGTGLELLAITIVVIGGTSLFGGEGGLFGTLLGALFIAVLANLLNLVGVSPFMQQIVQGGVLALAVLLDQLQRCRQRKVTPILRKEAAPQRADAGVGTAAPV
jgi:ribose transport system permease protein